MNGIWRIAVFVALVVVGSVKAAEVEQAKEEQFVDKRFYEVLEPYSRSSLRTILRPDKITEDNQLGDIYVWTDCHLLENKIGYVKLDCIDPYYDHKKRSVVEYTIGEKYPYREGTFMVRQKVGKGVGGTFTYTIKDPDYGKDNQKDAKPNHEQEKSDILII